MNESSSPFIVTLDGPAGVGKSTLAKRLAETLDIAYLDTGAMFRTLALYLRENGWSPEKTAAGNDEPAPRELLSGCVFTLRGSGAATELLCNGTPVSDVIRSEEAGMMAADIAVLPQIREYLKTAQQYLGNTSSLVAEGRDMGTAVFPSAACKIFLEAEPEIRAMRRYLQLRESGKPCNLAELTEHIRRRDQQDRNRAHAPLSPAEDAAIIDSSYLNMDEVFAAILRTIGAKRRTPPPVYAMRRQDRAISREECLALLAGCEYGLLATIDKSGWPYAVPLSYVFMDGAVYFHCAFTGHKSNNIVADNRVCFTVVGATLPVYDKNYSTYYESVIVFGRAFAVKDEQERTRGLRMLAEKYLPAHMDGFEESRRRSGGRTAVYKIVPDQITGKAKRPREKT